MKSEGEGGAHWLTTASKLVSSKGSSPASPWCQSISGQIRRVSANIVLKRRIGKKKKNELDGEVVRLRQTFRKINQRLF